MAIVLLSGRTGSSKKQVAKKLEEHWGYTRLTTYTTRTQLNDEAQKLDYRFIDGDKFEQMKKKGAFIETECHAGHMFGLTYGTLLDGIESETNCVIVLTPNGVSKVRKYLLENGILHVAAFVSDDTTYMIDRLMDEYEQNSLSKSELTFKLGNLIELQNSWEKDASQQAYFDLILQGEGKGGKPMVAARHLSDHVEKLKKVQTGKKIVVNRHKAA